MKLTKIVLAVSIMAAATTAIFTSDRPTVHTLKACHDYLWDVPESKNLSNAAISVFLGSKKKNMHINNWNISWDQPNIAAGGNCQVIKGEVIGFEQYGKNR